MSYMSSPQNNFAVGITGGIGAGKSVVSRILRSLGYPVFDCDTEAKCLMVSDAELRNGLIRLCDEEIYLNDGALDRARLASLIFNDSELLGRVNALVHKAVREKVLSVIRETEGVFFVEAAVMASSGLAKICDRIWLVDAPEDVRFARAMNRGGINAEDLRARMEAQRDEFHSLEQTGTPVKVINNSSGSSLLKRIGELLEDIKIRK